MTHSQASSQNDMAGRSGARATEVEMRRVPALLELFAAEGTTGLIRTPGSAVYAPARLTLSGFLPDGRLEWSIRGRAPPAPLFVELAIYDFLYRLTVRHAERAVERLITELPASVERAPLRWHLPLETDSIGLRFKGESKQHTVVRLSRFGVAIAGELDEPVEELTRVEIQLDSGRCVQALARLVEQFPDPAGQRELCCLELTWESPAARRLWEEEVDRLVNPRTCRSGTWASNLWELYDRSGYFQLSGKSPAHFAHLRSPFAVASRRLDLAPQIGCQIVWTSGRGAEAALSLLNLYEGTSMVCQVARRKDEPSPASARQMLRDINLHAFEQVQKNPALQWILVYVQEGGARWSRLAYQTFAESKRDEALSFVVPFRAMEASVHASPAASAWRVGRASLREQGQLLNAVRRSQSQAYAEALDLVPGRLGLDGIRSSWGQAGLVRERELVVARRDGRPVLAAVFESAQDAVHLFGLLDCVRFFQLDDSAEAAIPSVIDAARHWYRARGKEQFVCFFEAAFLPYAEQPGLRDLGAANEMGFSTTLLPEFLEHLYLITAPRHGGVT